MELYRLTRKKFAKSLSGKGAALKGARWNSAGIELVYAAANRSLAMAEVAVHFSLATLPADYVMMTLFVPDDVSMQKLDPSSLPADWPGFPHSASTQKIGDDFVRENKFCLLQVPSAVTKGDYNFLINTHHREFKRIKIVATDAFPFDNRLFRE